MTTEQSAAHPERPAARLLPDFAVTVGRLRVEFAGRISPGRVIAALAHAQLHVLRKGPSPGEHAEHRDFAAEVVRAAREHLSRQEAPESERVTACASTTELATPAARTAQERGRPSAADRRDTAAVFRDRAASARDRVAEERDRFVDPRFAAAAARDRQQSALDREWAARDRDASAGMRPPLARAWENSDG